MITSDHDGFAGVQPLSKHSPPANIRSPELSYRAQSCSPLSAPLIGADDHLRAAGLVPEEITQKDDYLRPPRLRRSWSTCKWATSGESMLIGGGSSAGVSPPIRVISSELTPLAHPKNGVFLLTGTPTKLEYQPQPMSDHFRSLRTAFFQAQ